MPHQKPATSKLTSTEPPFVVDHRFRDVDELVEVTRAWDLDFRQLNRGGFNGRVRQAVIGPVHLADTRMGGVLHQQGATPDGIWTFCFPGRNRMDFRWRGHAVGANDFLIHRPGGEFESVSRQAFRLLAISIPSRTLEAAGQRLGVAVSERALNELEITTCEPWIATELRGLVAIVLESLFNDQNPPEAIEERASDLLVQGLAAGIGPDCRIAGSRGRRLVEVAVCLARDRTRRIHTVKDLCHESGASERTLRRGFKERFGISPKAYLQAQRLIGVRRALRANATEATISDVANSWGFWHMGQFAADYRRHFGELPSETLAGAPRTSL